MPGSASKKKSEIVLDIDDDSLSSDFEDTEVVASETESKAKPLKRNQTASKKTIASSTEKELLSQESQGDISNVETDSFDVILPPLLGSGNSGECTVMIEVDPEDAALFDYEGISGAIGRFEADERGVVLDLKGCQYQGSILPGPTALVVGLSKGGQLRVEGITNEFATFVKTQDVMAKLDAVVEGEMDEGFQIREEDVNRVAKGPTATTDLADSKTNVKASKPAAPKRKSKGPTPDSAKSKTNAKASKPATSKKRKSTPK